MEAAYNAQITYGSTTVNFYTYYQFTNVCACVYIHIQTYIHTHTHSAVANTTVCKFMIKIVKATQSYPTLCDLMDYIVQGILQARILEWQPFPSPGDLLNPGIEPRSRALRADSLPAEPLGKPKQKPDAGRKFSEGARPHNYLALLLNQLLFRLNTKLYSSLCPYAITISSSSFITVWAHLVIR